MVVEDKDTSAPAPAPGEQLSTQVHPRLIDGVNNHNVMLFDLNSCALENFECHYNKYCAQQDLKPFLKEELQAELASRFDCKFKRVRISASIKSSRRACHRRDAGSTAWRCGSYTTRFSRH